MIVVRTLSEPPMPYDGIFLYDEHEWAAYTNILRRQTCDGYSMSDFFDASQVIDENPTEAITSFVLKLGYNKPLELLNNCYKKYEEYVAFVDKNMSVIFPYGMYTEPENPENLKEPEDTLEPELQKEKDYAHLLASETPQERDARVNKVLAELNASARRLIISEQKREEALKAKQSEWTTVGKK